MQVHQLKIGKRKISKRVELGGRRVINKKNGIKGQKARSGVTIDPLFEGGRSSLIERLKKIPGFKSPYPKMTVVKICELEKKFKEGDKVTPESLVKNKLVLKKEIRRGIKILGGGKLTKKLIISKNIALSQAAKTAIEKAGGKQI